MPVKGDKFPRRKPKDYATVRDDIRSGDILLCAGTNTVSKMIQGATESCWSHVAFILRLDGIQRIMVLESLMSVGVRTVPLSHYIRNFKGKNEGYSGKLLIARHSQFETVVNQDKLRAMSQFAVDRFGYPYDHDEMTRILSRIVASKLGMKPKKKTPDDREYICSEYAYECYKSIGIKIPVNKHGFISPADFAACEEINAVSAIKVES